MRRPDNESGKASPYAKASRPVQSRCLRENESGARRRRQRTFPDCGSARDLRSARMTTTLRNPKPNRAMTCRFRVSSVGRPGLIQVQSHEMAAPACVG